MKKIFMYAIGTSLFALFQTELIAQTKAESSRYNPTFSYEPPSRTQVASSGITIALLKPSFAKRTDGLVTPLQSFATAMQSEVEELLISKGYKVKGPFSSRDEMVFSDKKQSDFTLIISIDWDAQYFRTWKKIFGPGGFKIKKCDITIQTSLDIIAVSNFSGEKLWKKRLTLSSQSFSYAGKKDWKTNDITFWEEYAGDNTLATPLGKAMEVTYKEAMETLWKQFDLSEVKAIVEEAKKERSAENRKTSN